jgi:hypothetical protein
MSQLRSQYIELEGSIQKVFDSFKKSVKDYRPIYFNIASSTRSQENHLGMGNLGEMTAWNGQVSYQDFNKGYEVNYRHAKYSTGIQVERELMDDKEFAEIKKRSNKLAQAVYKSEQAHAVIPFNYAFSTFLAPDALSLCNAAHKITASDSSTQSNSGTLSLTVDNLETVMEAMRLFKDDKGDVMAVEPRMIICGEYWRKTAQQICGSNKEPFVADNQINVYDELTYNVNPRITGKKWFLVDPLMMKNGEGLNWYKRRDPSKVEYEDDFDTEVGKYKCVGRWSYGADGWAFIYGNNPS